jgi:hypothetical protein
VVKLDSNINGVLDRVKRRPRDIRQAMERTLAPAEWEAQLRAEAKRTIWALAKQPEWSFVEPFLQTIMVAPFLTGFFARMSNRTPTIGNTIFS